MAKTDLPDDQVLLERAQASSAGFAELFDAYYDRIYAYAYRRIGVRTTAEDVAASVFEDALRGIKRLKWQGKPIVAWLYRIASRRVADLRRRPLLESDGRENVVVSIEGPVESLERAEECLAVHTGLGRLAAKDREIIRLVFFDELDASEVAAVLNCTTNNAYVRLHRALKHLRAVLETEVCDE